MEDTSAPGTGAFLFLRGGIRILGGDGEELPFDREDKVAALRTVDEDTAGQSSGGILDQIAVFIKIGLHG